MSRRWLISILASITLVPSAHAEVFTSKEGGFQIQFSGKPEREVFEEPVKNGKVLMDTYMTFRNGVRTAVILSEYPTPRTRERADTTLETLQNNLVANSDGRLVSSEPGTFQGLRCRDLRVEGKAGNAAITTFGRMIVLDNRSYELMMAFPKGREDEAAYRKFRDSLKLTPAVARKKAPGERVAKVRPVDELFFVAFSGEPKVQQQVAASGAIGRHYTMEGVAGQPGIRVSALKAPTGPASEDPRALLELARKSAVKSGAEVRDERRFDLKGWPAYACQIKTKDGMWSHSLYVIIDSDTHMILTSNAQNIPTTPAQGAFLKSFEPAVEKK